MATIHNNAPFCENPECRHKGTQRSYFQAICPEGCNPKWTFSCFDCVFKQKHIADGENHNFNISEFIEQLTSKRSQEETQERKIKQLKTEIIPIYNKYLNITKALEQNHPKAPTPLVIKYDQLMAMPSVLEEYSNVANQLEIDCKTIELTAKIAAFQVEIKEKVEDLEKYFQEFEFDHYWANYEKYVQIDPRFYSKESTRALKGEDLTVLRKFIVRGIIQRIRDNYTHHSSPQNEMSQTSSELNLNGVETIDDLLLAVNKLQQTDSGEEDCNFKNFQFLQTIIRELEEIRLADQLSRLSAQINGAHGGQECGPQQNEVLEQINHLNQKFVESLEKIKRLENEVESLKQKTSILDGISEDLIQKLKNL